MGEIQGGSPEVSEVSAPGAAGARVLVAVPSDAAACVAVVSPPASPKVAAAPGGKAPTTPVSASNELDYPIPLRGPGVAGHVLAGALGAGVAIVFFSLLWLLDATKTWHVFRDSNLVPIFALDLALGIAAALRFGFRERAPRASALLLRGLGALLPGVAIWAALLFVTIGAGDAAGQHLDESGMAAVFFAMGFALAAIAGLRVRRAPKAPPPRRAPFTDDSRSVPLLWAGVLGGGLVVWVFAMVATYDHEVARIRGGSQALLLMGGVLGAAALASARGYAAGVRERISRGRRIAGAVGFGFLAACALALLLGMFGAIVSPRTSNMLIGVLVVSLAAVALGLGGVHVLVPRKRGRLREAGVTAGLLAVASLYPESEWMRYALGSERAAFALASEHFEDGDYELAARYFEIACERGNDLACMRASSQYDAGIGVTADAKRADRLLRLSCDDPGTCVELSSAAGDARTKERGAKRACDLDPAHYCARYRMVVLGDACSERDVFACRDLARLNEGNGSARLFYQKACSLGDADSCARAR